MTRTYDQTVETQTDLLDYTTHYLANVPVFINFTSRIAGGNFQRDEADAVELEYLDNFGTVIY